MLAITAPAIVTPAIVTPANLSETMGDYVAPAPAPAVKRLTMAQVRHALPQFFSTPVNDLVKSLTDKGTRIEALSQALAGCALERAQSGNMPTVWALVETSANALKGQTKARALSALAHVASIAPASAKGFDVADYEEFAYSTMVELVGLLTPPATVKKPATDKVDYKALAETYKAERDALAQELQDLRASLNKPVKETATA